MKEKLKKYIAEQPHIPTGFRYKTPILVSDSKGYTLRNAGRQMNFQQNFGASLVQKPIN